MKTTERALNIWASAIHHRAGGAEGHPVPREVHNEPAPGAATTSEAASSELTYDATKDKYSKRLRPRAELRVLAAIESVERALAACGATETLRRYLLFKYPTVGRYAPRRRAAKGTDPEGDPATAFVQSGHLAGVFGTFRTSTFMKCAARALEAAERAFLVQLMKDLTNAPSAGAGG